MARPEVEQARPGARAEGDVMSRWVELLDGFNAEVVYALLRRAPEGELWTALILLSGHPSLRPGTLRDFSSAWVDMSERL
jgi:hypothetical protein